MHTFCDASTVCGGPAPSSQTASVLVARQFLVAGRCHFIEPANNRCRALANCRLRYAAGRIFSVRISVVAHGCKLHGECLLVVGADAGVEPGALR
jgi:hypothetical protein